MTRDQANMLVEVAEMLNRGDHEVYRWLGDQLKECGGSELSTQLALGVIANLAPELLAEHIYTIN